MKNGQLLPSDKLRDFVIEYLLTWKVVIVIVIASAMIRSLTENRILTLVLMFIGVMPSLVSGLRYIELYKQEGRPPSFRVAWAAAVGLAIIWITSLLLAWGTCFISAFFDTCFLSSGRFVLGTGGGAIFLIFVFVTFSQLKGRF